MKKLLAAVAAGAIVLLAGAGFATATPKANEDGTRPNDHGLCTAYFNGQKNGWDNKEGGAPGPFLILEETGNAYTDSDGVDNDQDGDVDEEGEHTSLSQAENIFNYCNNMSEIGGNPAHGRFTCVENGASSDPECTDNEAPGKSGKN